MPDSADLETRYGYWNPTPLLRWIVKPLDADEKLFYVQDSHLGYCTDPMPLRRAQKAARALNQEQP